MCVSQCGVVVHKVLAKLFINSSSIIIRSINCSYDWGIRVPLAMEKLLKTFTAVNIYDA